MNHPNPPLLIVVAEHDRGKLSTATFAAIQCARQLCDATGGSFEVLVLGHGTEPIVESVQSLGATNILVADHPALEHPLAEIYTHIIVSQARQRAASMIVAAASTFSKDILPRVAALLDAGMLSDVTSVVPDAGDFTFRRIMFAGNVIATVKLDGTVKVFTIRPSAYSQPDRSTINSPVLQLDIPTEANTSRVEFISREEKPGGRPDPTEASIVVSGGRALKNAEDFERLVGGLADVLGGAVGSSRALVDAGITPNSLQIGQTGKVVAPALYIALGISGAIQHLAGMKDTKTIVAINQDSDAPIFEVADYGLVGDVYQVVPELIQKLKQV